MLYVIDESCLKFLDTKDEKSICFFEELALNRRKCKNLLVANRKVLDLLAKSEALSLPTKNIYKMLRNRASEFKLIIENTKKYCRVVAELKDNERIIFEEGHEIIQIIPTESIDKDLTDKTIMLAENTEDIVFYKTIGQYYIKKKNIGNFDIMFEERMGGGDTTNIVLQEIINKRTRMCLCIVDSDKKYKEATCGETMKKILEITSKISHDFFDVVFLEMHEVENLVPLSILRKVSEKILSGKDAVNFMEFLLSCDSTQTSPVYYFDLKKGVSKGAFILKEQVDEKTMKKYRKLELYRKYWSVFLEEYGKDINDIGNDEHIVSGISQHLLKHVITVFEDMKKEGSFEKFIVDEYIQEYWLNIGEKIFCWGCVGHKIAA